MIPISVVIPTRNAAATIEACLASILMAIPAEFRDVIVVDNGSTDGTLDLVRRFPVQLEVVSTAFVSASRNHGARLARQPLLAFVDSDCTVRTGWYEAVEDALADRSVGATGGRHELRDSPTWVEAAWDKAHRRAEARPRYEVAYIPAGNFATWRRIFADVNGFDETLETGEDPDLCARIAARGFRIVESRAIRCVHLGEPRTLTAVFRRQRWHGRGARFRYGDGRLAPITFSTFLFGANLVAGVGALTVAGRTGSWIAAAGVLTILAIPGIYAARYAKAPRARHLPQLWAIYLAYFLGRARALPVVVNRLLRPTQTRSSVAGRAAPG